MDWVAIILVFGTINTLIIGLLLLSIRNAKMIATRLFGIIVILFSIMIGQELADYLQWNHKYPVIIGLTDGFILIAAPLFYFYALLITDKKWKFSRIDLLHAIPFLLFTLYLLPFYLKSGPEKILNSNYNGHYILSLLKFASAFCYFALSLTTVLKFSRSDQVRRLPANNSRNVFWYKWFLISLIVMAILVGILEILFARGVDLIFDPDTFAVLLLSCLFYVNSIALIRNPFILWGVAQFQELIVEPPKSFPEKYKTSPLSEEDLQSNLSRFMKLMEDDRLFLDPELTPIDMERKTGIKAYYISQTLNTAFDKNFNEFVNAYRVREAQRLLSDPKESYKTVLALGLESGFNSKSSFNRVFKNHTGLTPSQYQKKYLK